MLKHVLSLILSVVMILSVITAASAAPASALTGASAPASVGENDAPEITGVKYTAAGVTVKWSPADGAAKYALMMQKSGGSSKEVGTTASTSFACKSLSNNVVYTFTVKALASSGDVISTSAGYDVRYHSIPALTSVTSVFGGHRVKWSAVKGAEAYMVYVKTSAGWQSLGTTASASYTNPNAASGKKYTYTVRCCNQAGTSSQSYFDSKGVSGTYIASPLISSFTPAKGGVTLKWAAVSGASSYAVFLKQSGKWKKIAATANTSYKHTSLKNGVSYTYTLRCTDKNGKYISGYDAAGSSCKYLAPPKIKSAADNTITWTSVTGAVSYRVCRNIFGSKRSSVGVTEALTYTDTNPPAGTPYTYSVAALDENQKAITYYADAPKYYVNGSPADGKYTISGKQYSFKSGVQVRQGYVTVNGKMYYYNASGVLQKNGLVGTKKLGYRYADKNGVINLTYTGLAKDANGRVWYLYKGKVNTSLRCAVKIKGKDYNILDGRAYVVKTNVQRTLNRALKLVSKVTKSSMTKAQKLKACWKHIRTSYGERNPRIPHYHGSGWAELYANDIFVNGSGNCFSYGAAFAYIGKAIGYKNCYACNSGGHGWAEIDGRVYDPEWSMHSKKYTYYGLKYTDPCDVKYKSGISRGESWMHVAVG